MLKIAHVGYGYWGTNVVRNIAASAKTDLRAIIDVRAERVEAARKAYPAVPMIGTDVRAVLEDPAIEAVALAIQTEPAFELARAVLNAGKHLFIEKPLAENGEKAAILAELSEKTGRVLHIDHLMLFHPIIRRIKELYDSGELGKLIYVDVSRMNLGPIRKDVNAMLDLAVHDLAVIDYISDGAFPYHVEAIGETHYGSQETLTYLTLKYPSFLAHIKSSWISPIKERRTIIGCEKKMVIFDDMKTVDKLTIYDQGIVETGEEYGAYEYKARTGDITIPYIQQRDALRSSIEHFADCVAAGRESIADGRQGVKIAKILDEARRKLDATRA